MGLSFFIRVFLKYTLATSLHDDYILWLHNLVSAPTINLQAQGYDLPEVQKQMPGKYLFQDFFRR